MYLIVHLLLWVHLVLPLCTALTHQQMYFMKLSSSSYAVDKTLFIKDLLDDDVRYHIITCPHGFGKSINLEMLRRFVQLPLNREHHIQQFRNETSNFRFFTDPQNNLKISRHAEIFNRHFGDYLTIFFNFDIDDMKTYQEIIHQISLKMRSAFESYRWFYKLRLEKDAGVMYQKAKVLFERMYSLTATEDDLINGIQTLAEAVSLHYGKKRVFLFIDNYDTPILKAFQYSTDSKKVHDFIQRMLMNVITSTPAYVRRAVLYGVSGMVATSVGGTEELQPRHELLGYRRFLDDHPLNEYCGFTDDETEQLFDRHQINREERQKLAKYYNGYRSEKGAPYIYNPTSVVAYLEECSRQNGTATINKYWSRNQTALTLPRRMKHIYLRDLCNELILFRKLHHNWPQPLLFQPDRDFQEFENMLNPNYDGIEYPPVIYIAHLYELGYLSYFDGYGTLQIPNLETQAALERYHNQYYTEVARIHETKLKRIAYSLQPIVEEAVTTRGMLDELHDSLSDPDIINYFYDNSEAKYLRKGKQRDFNALLFISSTIHGCSQLGRVVSKANVSMLIDGKLSDTFERVTPVDLFVSSKTRKNVLFVQVGFEGNIQNLIEHLTQLVPRMGRKQPLFVKHIAVNMKNKKIQIATAPPRQFSNGQWEIIS